MQATAGTSYSNQVKKFGQNYILPVVGDRRIGDLNTGMLQDVLNRAYKEGSMNPQATRKSRGNLSKKTLQGIRAAAVTVVSQCAIAWVVAFLVRCVGLIFGWV